MTVLGGCTEPLLQGELDLARFCATYQKTAPLKGIFGSETTRSSENIILKEYLASNTLRVSQRI